MILITGGTGFIGTYLVNELTKLENETLLVTTVSKSEADFGNIKVLKLDVTKKDDFKKLPDDVDTVFHVAAFVSPSDDVKWLERFFSINANGTYNLLEFARKKNIGRFIYSSTVNVCKIPPDYLPIDEKHPTYPLSFYGMSKLFGEMLCTKYQEEYGLSCISLRYSPVYGKGQKPLSVLPIFVNNVINNKPPIVFGTGEYSQDFIYVKDVVKANILAYHSKKTGIYNIASGRKTDIITLAKTTIDAFDKKLEPIIDSSKLEIPFSLYYDISKAKKELGFEPQYDLKSGLLEYKRLLLKRDGGTNQL